MISLNDCKLLMLWFSSVESYHISIIMDRLRSPHTIRMAHCHEFHMGRVILRGDRVEKSSYWPHLITWVERFLELIMDGVLEFVDWVQRFLGLIICVVFGSLDWVEWFPRSVGLDLVNELTLWLSRVSPQIERWSNFPLRFIWRDIVNFMRLDKGVVPHLGNEMHT